jgi:hypothetical protein
MALGAILKSALPLLPAVIGAMQKPKQTQAERQQSAAAAQADAFMRELANPNSQYVQNFANDEEQKIRRDTVDALEEVVRANRRQTAMGRRALLDPQRSDEFIYRAFAKSVPDARMQARQNARNYITGLATGSTQAANTYGSMVGNQRDIMQRSQQRNVELARTGSDLAKVIFDEMEKRRQPQQIVSPRFSPMFSGVSPWPTSFQTK